MLQEDRVIEQPEPGPTDNECDVDWEADEEVRAVAGGLGAEGHTHRAADRCRDTVPWRGTFERRLIGAGSWKTEELSQGKMGRGVVPTEKGGEDRKGKSCSNGDRRNEQGGK